MERGYGWLPFHDMDWASWIEHRRRHLEAVLSKARQDDEAAAEIERLLREVDAAIAAGDASAPAQPEQLTDSQRQALGDPCPCPECQKETG